MIINSLKTAQESIYIAMYRLSDSQIASAVIKAAENDSVSVFVLVDRQEVTLENPKGIQLRVMRGYQLHHKFAVIDERLVITGSYNWSDRADTTNFENILFITSTDPAKAYIAEFQDIWIAAAR